MANAFDMVSSNLAQLAELIPLTATSAPHQLHAQSVLQHKQQLLQIFM